MGGFDWRRMSRSQQILGACGVLLFIDMLFTWQGVSILGTTVGVSGWHGLNGVLLGIAVIALVAFQVVLLLGERASQIRDLVPVPDALASAALAGAVLVLGILKFLTANEVRRWPEWVGLILAIAIGYGGWLAYSGSTHAGSEPVNTPSG
jgi:hypothetical protein